MALKTISTIGYEKVGLADFVAAVKDANIALLLDIRDLPNSRRAGFSKNMLAAALAEASIGYRHFKALGTPKAGRDAAKKGDVNTMHAIFEAKMMEPASQLALTETADLARGQRVCLMCLEHDWRSCHRAIVAEKLAALGLKARHLEPEPRL